MKHLARYFQSLALLIILFGSVQAESVLSPEGKTALVSGAQGKIQLWDLAAGRVIRVFSGHTGSVTALAFSPDAKTFLSGGEDGTVRLWDIDKGVEVWGINYEGDRRYPLFRQYGNDIQYVAFMPDGKQVLMAQRDGTIKLLDSQTGKDVRAFKTAKEFLWTASLSPNGKTVVTTSTARNSWTIHLWDVATGDEVLRFNDTSTASSAALLPDGKRLLSGGNHSLRLWDVATGKLLQTLSNPTLIASISLSPDGKVALVGAAYKGNGVITKWDMTSGKIAGRLTRHTSDVSEISFSADSTTALSAGYDNALIVWDVAKGTILHKFNEGSASLADDDAPNSKPNMNVMGGGGVLDGLVISKPAPVYPQEVHERVSGQVVVVVQVVVDETGRVISAKAVSGHPLLQASAVAAARKAVFAPTLLSGMPVKVAGVLTYKFTP
jgi:TonB family protein